MITLADAVCASGGWCPGSGTTGVADPTTAAAPDTLFTTLKTTAVTVFTSAGGAMLLFMVGIWALMRGWSWYSAHYRKPYQPTLPGL